MPNPSPDLDKIKEIVETKTKRSYEFFERKYLRTIKFETQNDRPHHLPQTMYIGTHKEHRRPAYCHMYACVNGNKTQNRYGIRCYTTTSIRGEEKSLIFLSGGKIWTEVALCEPFCRMAAPRSDRSASEILSAFFKICFIMKGFTSKPPMRIDDPVARELSAFLVVISKSNNVDEPIVIESDSDEQNKKGHNTSPDGPIVLETDSEDEINHGHDSSMGKPTVIEIDSNKEKGKARYTKLEEPELETESFNPHGNKSLFRAAIPRSAESNLMFGGSKIEQDQGIRDSISTDELDGGTPCVAFPKKSDHNSHKITSVSTAKETTIATGVKKCHARKEREVPNNSSIGLRRPLRSARRTENSSVSLNGRKKSCDKIKAGGTNTTLSTLVKHLSEDEVEDQENEDIGSKYDEKEEHKNNNDDTDNHSDVSAEAMRSHRVRSLRTRNALITKDQKKVTDLELHCENMVEEFFKAYNPKTLEIGALKKRIEKRKKRMMKFQEDMSDFEIREALGETE